ncbi:MAG TPA: HNH endonuclease [Candidatus Binatia bacterium]|nr:HNH endonuclease [Candidatus Binatia bacterium]
MKTILLTRGKVAVVDDEDYERVSAFKWFAMSSQRGPWYARRDVKRRAVLLHRVIMNAPEGVEVDHINGDGLDCRKTNLRLATRSQNQHNKTKYKRNKSGFKGVCWHRASDRWLAQIRVDAKNIYLGVFATPEEAARAYDVAAQKHHGEFCRVNF